jgi:hypothetical protein
MYNELERMGEVPIVYFKVLSAGLFIWLFLLTFFHGKADSREKPKDATPTEIQTRYLLHVRDISTFV